MFGLQMLPVGRFVYLGGAWFWPAQPHQLARDGREVFLPGLVGRGGARRSCEGIQVGRDQLRDRRAACIGIRLGRFDQIALQAQRQFGLHGPECNT